MRMKNELLLSALLVSCSLPALALEEAGSTLSPRPETMARPETMVSMTVAALTNSAAEYKTSSDDVSWNNYFNVLKDALASPGMVHADMQLFIQSNPSLAEFKMKVNELPAGRVISFPQIRESHTVLFQTRQGRVFLVPMPPLTALREVKQLSGAQPSDKAPAKSSGKSGETAGPLNYLAFIGGDRMNSTLWFKGYKMNAGTLFEAPELFSSLPPFFTQNVTGRASFAANDIVLTILPPVSPDAKAEEDKSLPKPKAQPVGYKVMLKFLGNKYAISGKLPDDGPMSVALNFAQAVASNKPELAKAWLIDPRLVSIPKYIGIMGRVSPPMRLVSMSGPASGGARYRLVTGSKDDLIIEVGRILSGKLKGQVAIRALFVAPPDSFAQSLMGTMVMPGGASGGAAPTASKPSGAAAPAKPALGSPNSNRKP